MKKILFLLSILFTGCTATNLTVEPVLQYGTLYKVEELRIDTMATVKWYIITENNDTIIRPLVRVNKDTKPGSQVPYFIYE